MSASTPDVYGVLGISRSASAALARDMYWQKLQPYLEADGDTSAEGRAAIEELNRALSIVLDERKRREFDEGSPEAGLAAKAESQSKRKYSKGLLWMTLGLATAGSVSILDAPYWTAAATGSSVCLTGLFLNMRGRRSASRSTTDPLQLDAQASAQEIELAYQVRAQALLLQLRRRPEVIGELEDLDKSYVAAMTALLAAESTAERRTSPRSRSVLFHQVLTRTLLTVASTSLSAIEGMSRTITSQAGRLRNAVRGHEWAGNATSSDYISRDQIQRRLVATGLHAQTEELARAVHDADPLVESWSPPTAFLLLEAAIGTRRVPISDKPVSIGTAGHCDLVLPKDQDVLPEHASVWRNGSRVVLHATLDAPCYVNGDLATWALLDEGDVLQVGTYTLRVSVAKPIPMGV